MDKTVYIDWAATAIYDTEILDEALKISKKAWANPSSIHKAGIFAKNTLQEYRQRTAITLGVKPESLYYTSGGTESNHLPLLSLLLRPSKGSILISSIEHPSVTEQALMLKHCGWEIIPIPCDTNGIIQAEAVSSKLRNDTAMVYVMAVNNETGAIQPIDEIAQILQDRFPDKKKPKLHVDAVQAIGKIPFNLSNPLIDSASISAHKLGGPRGIGLLYMPYRQEPFLRGGGQENGIRSGTENLYGATALCLCLEKNYLGKKQSTLQRLSRQKKMTSDFISSLATIKNCTIIPATRQTPEFCNEDGWDSRFSPWIIQASFEGIPSEVLVRALSEKNIYISSGSACSARKLSRPVLEAMKISKKQAGFSVRLSFGYGTTEEDLNILLTELKNTVSIFS